MIMIAKVLWKVEKSIQISLHISRGPVIEKFTCSIQQTVFEAPTSWEVLCYRKAKMTYRKETWSWELQVQWKKSISMQRYIPKKWTENKCWGKEGTCTLHLRGILWSVYMNASQFFI